ncbi:hypothetical protein N7520_003010 [Penicillium odoratum]|uniref:uncharacterized protein n=1 Tax=Penicillium odoratum TaxID=1167516 RepID=UPI002546C6A1|nr:uncharacterized protein N7520_003010 [Penicillium odoratum]KAJ5772481.1 hypothetical protein N7520_003010 [Penicillium odoratum]
MVDGMQEFQATTVINVEVWSILRQHHKIIYPFWTDAGIPAEGTTLPLSLGDFKTEELPQDVTGPGLDKDILITSGQLYNFPSSAESRQQAHTKKQGSINRIRPGALKRRRPGNPSEQLSSDEKVEPHYSI